MKTLEQKTAAEQRLNGAMKGAALNLTLAVIGELIGSYLLMGAGIGALSADVAVVAYYGIRHREYFGQDNSNITPQIQ